MRISDWSSDVCSSDLEFTTTCVNDAAGAIDIVQNDHFDLVLLDVGLPDMDGRDVCKELRRLGVRAPILMLTAADADTDTSPGPESGANEHVAKPFKLGVMLARTRDHLAPFGRIGSATWRSRVGRDGSASTVDG